MNLSIFLIFFANFLLSEATTENPHPRIKIRMSKSGLDHIGQYFWKILVEKVNSGFFVIPDMDEGDMKAKNIRFGDLDADVTSLLTPPSILGFSVKNGRAKLTSDVRACKKILFQICENLAVTATINRAEMELGLKWAKSLHGKPEIQNIDCRVNIGRLDLKISGGLVGWAADIFSGRIARSLKPKIENQLCQKARNFFMTDLNETFEKMSTKLKLRNLIEIDYGLAGDPVIFENHAEIAFKGDVSSPAVPFGKSSNRPSFLAADPKTDRSLSILISESFFNDFLYFSHISNFTRYQMNEKIPFFVSHLFSVCKIFRACPNVAFLKLFNSLKAVELNLSTSAPPEVKFRVDRCSVDVRGTVGAYALQIDDSTRIGPAIAVLAVTLLADVDIRAKNDRLTGQISIGNLDLRVLHAIDEKLKLFLEIGSKLAVGPLLEVGINEVLGNGMKIPKLGNHGLENPEIRFFEQSVMIESDFGIFD